MVKDPEKGNQNQAMNKPAKSNSSNNLKLRYKQRKDCIKKKTMQLSTLCGVKACAICISPEGEIDTWPENHDDVKAIIQVYKEHENNAGKKKNARKRNTSSGENSRDKRDCFDHGLSTELGLSNVLDMVDAKLKAVNERIELLKLVSNERKEIIDYNVHSTHEEIMNKYEFDTVDIGLMMNCESYIDQSRLEHELAQDWGSSTNIMKYESNIYNNYNDVASNNMYTPPLLADTQFWEGCAQFPQLMW